MLQLDVPPKMGPRVGQIAAIIQRPLLPAATGSSRLLCRCAQVVTASAAFPALMISPRVLHKISAVGPASSASSSSSIPEPAEDQYWHDWMTQDWIDELVKEMLQRDHVVPAAVVSPMQLQKKHAVGQVAATIQRLLLPATPGTSRLGRRIMNMTKEMEENARLKDLHFDEMEI